MSYITSTGCVTVVIADCRGKLGQMRFAIDQWHEMSYADFTDNNAQTSQGTAIDHIELANILLRACSFWYCQCIYVFYVELY